jgi:hypothetical protein
LSPRERRNLPASVRQRLLNRARDRGEDFQYVLSRYAIERLLYRLGQSRHSQRFVLKGATLFDVWTGQTHRPTRDLDLLCSGDPSVLRMEQILRELCDAVHRDGLDFDPASVSGEEIRGADEYTGVRVRLQARLAGARIPIRVDVGFGDAVVPAPEPVDYPPLLDLPAPVVRAYPREAVAAEKFSTLSSGSALRTLE